MSNSTLLVAFGLGCIGAVQESAVQSLRAHYKKQRGGKPVSRSSAVCFSLVGNASPFACSDPRVRDVKLDRSVEKVCKVRLLDY